MSGRAPGDGGGAAEGAGGATRADAARASAAEDGGAAPRDAAPASAATPAAAVRGAAGGSAELASTAPRIADASAAAPAGEGGTAAASRARRAARGERAYVIAMCAIIGAAFAYAACEWGHWPRFAYLPLRGQITTSPPPGIAMHYAGIVAWGLGGLAAGALAGALLCRLFPRPWPERALQLFGAWALTALLLAGGYFTWGLWPW